MLFGRREQHSSGQLLLEMVNRHLFLVLLKIPLLQISPI
jgi:hypothetical protein